MKENQPSRSSSTLRRVVLAAGGTAGHVFPALAIRELLTTRGVDSRLYCDDRALAFVGDIEPSAIDVIPSGGLVTGSIPARLTNLGRLARGALRARALLRSYRPDLVIGLGGYASVGPIVMANRLGISTVLHEQNSVMGVANKVSARRADTVALTFDPTEGASGRCVVTGNPTRPPIVAIGDQPFPQPSPSSTLGILVMGGSQGARAISDRVPAALASLPVSLRDRLRVVHQARPEDRSRVTKTYTDGAIDATVEPFVDVAAVLPRTQLVVSRSGATTVCDLAAARRPALYLPLLSHADRQQVKNAQAVVDAGGAVLLDEDNPDQRDLAATIAGLLRDPARLAAMADAARRWSRPDAAARVVDLVAGRSE